MKSRHKSGSHSPDRTQQNNLDVFRLTERRLRIGNESHRDSEKFRLSLNIKTTLKTDTGG